MKRFILTLSIFCNFFLSIGQEVRQGYNTAFAFYGLENPQNVYEQIKSLDEVQKPILRFPGGTIANRYRLDGVDYGTTNFTDRNFVYDFIDLCHALDADAVIVLNLFEELVFSENLYNQNIELIELLLANNIRIVGVELGNEFYLYPEITGVWIHAFARFQKGSIVRGAEKYVELCRKYASTIKNDYGLPTGLVLGSNNNFRDKTWNEVIHNSGVGDFYVHHFYLNPRNRINKEKTNFIKDIPVLAGNKKVWITEWNAQFGFRADQNMNYFLSDEHLNFLSDFPSWCDPKYVEVITLHALMGASENTYNKYIHGEGQLIKRW